MHNQTGNVYSHLIPAIVLLVGAFGIYDVITTRYATADVYDILAFGVFVTSAIVCFGLSASFHLLGNHSSKVYHTWLLMDLYGIFVLIAGTVYSGTYYGFYCEPNYWIIYSLGVSNWGRGNDKEVLTYTADRSYRRQCCNAVFDTAIPHP